MSTHLYTRVYIQIEKGISICSVHTHTHTKNLLNKKPNSHSNINKLNKIYTKNETESFLVCACARIFLFNGWRGPVRWQHNAPVCQACMHGAYVLSIISLMYHIYLCVAVLPLIQIHIHTCMHTYKSSKWDKLYCEACMKNCTKKTHTQSMCLLYESERRWYAIHTERAAHIYKETSKHRMKWKWGLCMRDDAYVYSVVPNICLSMIVCVCGANVFVLQ